MHWSDIEEKRATDEGTPHEKSSLAPEEKYFQYFDILNLGENPKNMIGENYVS